MRHVHTPAENFMLANVYLDVIDGLMTLEEANAYLCAQYEHHPSRRSVTAYLDAAKDCYATMNGGASRNGRRRRAPPAAKRRFSRDLDFEMHLAVDQRAGD
jgi:hypothetical protein